MDTETAVRDELVGLLRYANKTAVARELGVSAQAVINWSEGRNTTQGRLEQVRRLYGLDNGKSAPHSTVEDGALAKFMRRWDSDEPPRWAKALADQIDESVKAVGEDLRKTNREDLAKMVRDSMGRATRAAVSGRLPTLGGEAPPGPPGVPASQPVGSKQRKRSGGGQGQ